jgi:two-component system cell cycle sensor histidine kinase/response regulator CckA
MEHVKILIVEDESIVAFDLKQHLELAGYEVCGIFSSGEDTLAQFEALSPDLVLMDIKLKGRMDGVETASIIKERYKIPVIILTAFADDETIERAKITEPFGYIIKPFEDRKLKTTIEITLSRYRLEKKLSESEEKYRKFFEDDLSGDFIADKTGRIVDCNPAFVNIFGFSSKEEALSMNMNEFFVDAEFRESFWKQVRKEKKLQFSELVLLSPAKVPLTMLTNVVSIYGEGESFKGIKGYLFDITESKRLERQLRQSQKMEAIGRLAGGVAHDFNNILTVIMGYTAMIAEKIADDEPIDNDLEGIKKASRKATNLTRQLLAFSRSQILNPENIDINDLIKDTEKMLSRLITEDISVSYYLEATHANAFVDPGQVEQVLMNLAVNARDAMPGGGKLIIETRNVTFEEERSLMTGVIQPGTYICLSVRDTGTGMTKETLSNIFEPFYTTKPAEKGTGLGLSTVYGIVKQHDGYINVDSSPGKGSAFYVYFRIAEKKPASYTQEASAVSSLEGNEDILVVEDEENIRLLIARILSRKGYRVHEAQNAGEALLISENLKGKIDLLISDLIMPHMNGQLLAERLEGLRPDIRVLFISGYPDKTIRERGISDLKGDFMQKPFEPEALLLKVREILDRE